MKTSEEVKPQSNQRGIETAPARLQSDPPDAASIEPAWD